MRFALALAFAGSLAGSATAQENTPATAAGYVVLLQDFAADSCTFETCGLLGKPLVDGLLALENNARRKDLQRQLAVLRSRAPALDLRALVAEAVCTQLLQDPNPACAAVTVLGAEGETQVGRVARVVPRQSSPGTMLVRLSIEYSRQMRFNELRLIAALSQVDGNAKLGKPLLYCWYTTPGTDATQSSPLDAPPPKPTKKQLSTEAHWFGTDHLLESEIRRAIPELAEMIRQSQPYLPGGNRAADWKSLQTLGDLQAARNHKVGGAMSQFRVLGSRADRVWIVQQASAPVVMSTPIDMWD